MITRRDFLRYSTACTTGLCLAPAQLELLATSAGTRRADRKPRVLVLDGRPRERGRIHGENFKDRILERAEQLRTEFRPPVGTDVSDYLAKFMFLESIREQIAI